MTSPPQPPPGDGHPTPPAPGDPRQQPPAGQAPPPPPGYGPQQPPAAPGGDFTLPPPQPPAPQGPPPSGYGHPQPAAPAWPQQPPAVPPPGYGQQPAAPSGYGHPQAPPPSAYGPPSAYPAAGAPAGYPPPGAAPGYPPPQDAGQPVPFDRRETHPGGYAGAPPAGWGPQPGGQPPYGQQPPYAPPGGGRPGKGGRILAIVTGVVVIALLAGGSLWYFGRGGSHPVAHTSATPTAPTAPHTGTVRWTADWDKPAGHAIDYPTPGMWFSDDHVVKQTADGVSAYEVSGGKKVWTVSAPGGHTCNASQTAADHAVVVQYGAKCGSVMAVDIRTGTLRWRKDLPLPTGGADYAFQYADLAVAGSTVALAYSETSVAYSLRDGHREWGSTADGDCHDEGFAGGTRMVEVYRCGFGVTVPYKVRVIDPETAKPTFTWSAPADTRITSVVSVDPLVIGLGTGDHTLTGLWNVEGGRLHAKVALGSSNTLHRKYDVECGVELTPCSGVIVSGDTLYLTGQPDPDVKGPIQNTITAVDLETGTTRWVTHGTGHILDAVAVDGDNLIAYQEPPLVGTGRVLRIARSTGRISTYITMSSSTEQTEQTAYLPTLGRLSEGWYHDTLFLGMTRINPSDKLTPYLLAALG